MPLYLYIHMNMYVYIYIIILYIHMMKLKRLPLASRRQVDCAMTLRLPFSLFPVKNQTPTAPAMRHWPMAMFKALFHRNTKNDTAKRQSKT